VFNTPRSGWRFIVETVGSLIRPVAAGDLPLKLLVFNTPRSGWRFIVETVGSLIRPVAAGDLPLKLLVL
jgi:hypothetical protein